MLTSVTLFYLTRNPKTKVEACSNKSDQVLLGRLEFPTRALWDDLVPINLRFLQSVLFWERCSQVLATPFSSFPFNLAVLSIHYPSLYQAGATVKGWGVAGEGGGRRDSVGER